jgi:hypothetical protein
MLQVATVSDIVRGCMLQVRALVLCMSVPEGLPHDASARSGPAHAPWHARSTAGQCSCRWSCIAADLARRMLHH